ncbi:MAG: methionyl-tRNA formyltransferase [Oscillospiraceae bacterium]|nr:methionyl-tRNA formyltransferase [Oscillospiraceae bacterium]
MRILFMGTPDFAVPSLSALVRAGHTVCGAFTQPDRKKNRGMKLVPSPVKEFCEAEQIPVFQPEGFRDPEAVEQIRQLSPDLIVVAAYGKILPETVLSIPKLGCVNVHSSLLPAYRGAAPVNWAIINGESRTGVTIMYMSAELDAGDIIDQKAVDIGPDETAGELTDRLAVLGASLLTGAVSDIGNGTATRTPQDPGKATYAPMLTRELSPVDWSMTAEQIHNRVRGLLPWPAATAILGGTRCKLLRTRICPEKTDCRAGTVLAADRSGLRIAAGDDTSIELLTVQPDGKKPMEAEAFLAGHPIEKGSILS